MANTSEQYDRAVKSCQDIFEKKMKDYGVAWRVLRPSSITDQLYIKAKRISTIEENGESKVNEGVVPEYIAIVNYCVMALVQIELGESSENTELPVADATRLYEEHFLASKTLMENKNHDYDEAWRDMRLSSLTDLILMKLLRTKQIEDNEGKTLISEGIDANYADMLNYAVFALIKIEEESVN